MGTTEVNEQFRNLKLTNLSIWVVWSLLIGTVQKTPGAEYYGAESIYG